MTGKNQRLQNQILLLKNVSLTFDESSQFPDCKRQENIRKVMSILAVEKAVRGMLYPMQQLGSSFIFSVSLKKEKTGENLYSEKHLFNYCSAYFD